MNSAERNIIANNIGDKLSNLRDDPFCVSMEAYFGEKFYDKVENCLKKRFCVDENKNVSTTIQNPQFGIDVLLAYQRLMFDKINKTECEFLYNKSVKCENCPVQTQKACKGYTTNLVNLRNMAFLALLWLWDDTQDFVDHFIKPYMPE